MKLNEIFSRNIERAINPAVIVSAKDPKTIEAEIKEYVFTPEIIEKLFTIIESVIFFFKSFNLLIVILSFVFGLVVS